MSQEGGLRFDELRSDYSGIPDATPFQARDGSQLWYRYYPARSDVHLVLVHGSGSHGRYLFPLAREISGRNAAHVHTPDLRGHGVAPDRRGDIDYVEQLEDDLADLLALIRSRHPGARIVVGGHSSGGGLALRFAGSRHGRQAHAFLLLAPFLRHDAPTARRGSGGWALPKTARIVALTALNAMGIKTLNALTAIEFAMPKQYRDGTETLSYTFRMNVGFAPRSFEADLRAIGDRPLLVLVGGRDEVFVPEAYAPTVKAIAPHAVVEVVPEVTHMGIAVGSASAERVSAWLSAL